VVSVDPQAVPLGNSDAVGFSDAPRRVNADYDTTNSQDLGTVRTLQ
jgi:hypothetical protein